MMDQDPDRDEVLYCDVCGEIRMRFSYELAHGGKSWVLICDRCANTEARRFEANVIRRLGEEP